MYSIRDYSQVEHCLKEISVNAKVINNLSTLTITQNYEVTGDSSVEVYYKFPVPANNSITGFTISVGDKVICAQLKEKSSAVKEYKKAMADGDSGFLLQSCDDDSLECCLGNIVPGAKVTVVVSLCGELKCERDSQNFRMIIPTTIANKYRPTSYRSTQSTGVNHGKITYSMKLHFDIKMIGGIKSIKCNETVFNPNCEEYSFDVEPDNLDKDIVILIQRNINSTFAVCNDGSGIGDFNCATQINIVPESDSLVKCPAADIHYCLILDRSGSMSSDMEVLKEAAKTAINVLPSGCFTDVYTFNDRFERFTCDAPNTSSEYKTKALEWIKHIKSRGGTEIIPVLEDAYSQIDKSGKIGSIAFLSDGEVHNVDTIIDLIKEHPSVKVFTIGIGNNVSAQLINDMAEAGMGTSEFAKNVKDTLESKVALTMLRAQNSAAHQNRYTLDITTDGSYTVIPKDLPPLVENYNNIFYVFSKNPVKCVKFNGYQVPIDHRIDCIAINQIAARKYMKSMKCQPMISRISHLNTDETNYDDSVKNDMIACSIVNNVLCKFTAFVGVDKREIKSTGEIQLVEVPLQAPQRSLESVKCMASTASAFCSSSYSPGGLSGLSCMATGMMKKMGYQQPPGMKPPSEQEISTVIGTVFNNETTQTAIQSMFSSLQGCQDFGSAVQTVVKNVTDLATMEAIQGLTKPESPIVTKLDARKLNYTKSGDLFISDVEESLNNLSNVELNDGDLIEIDGLGTFKVLVVGSSTNKWVLKMV